MGAAQASDSVVAAATQIDRYWYQDGINEISAGIGMLSISAVSYMIHRQMVTASDWIAITLGLGGVAVGLTEGWVKKLLRERFSYPRIGYLSERRGEPLSRRRKVVAGAFLIVVLGLPLVVLTLIPDYHRPVASMFGWLRWFPMVAGAGLFVGGMIDYRRFRLPRLLIGDALVMITGVATSVLIDAAFLPSAIFWLAVAIIKVISGSSALVTLVRTVPVMTE